MQTMKITSFLNDIPKRFQCQIVIKQFDQELLVRRYLVDCNELHWQVTELVIGVFF